MELPPAAQESFIVERCGGDEALLHDLRAMLEASAREVLIDRPVAEIAAGLGVANADVIEPGRRVGAWRIVSTIGEGGMGRVYLAERADGQYEQSVALKVILGELVSDAALARFVAERGILARLDHPGIASLVDGGVDDRGRPWFAMQYVDGRTLPDYCAEKVLTLNARVRLIVSICEAVAYAHRQLVVHCDLKPSNVLVDASGNPRLLDFGIARLLDPHGGDGEKTQTQLRALTPGYAAPEQLAGAPVGIPTDVYALGTILYEILAGARPYANRDSTPAAIAVAQSQGEPLLLSRAANAQSPVPPRRLRGDLELIVAKSLRHDPKRRYRDADAFAEDLRRYLAGRPIVARADSTLYRWRKFVSRNRVGVVAAALIALILISATVVSVREANVARAQANRAEAVQRFISGVFAQADPEDNKGAQLTAHQLLEKADQQMRRLDAQPAVRADIGIVIGDLYGEISDFERSEAVLKEALAASQGAGVPDDVKARALISISHAESERNAYDSALDHARAALDLLRGSGSANAVPLAHAHLRIGEELGRKGDNVAAERMLRDALETDRASLGERDETVLEEQEELATVLGNVGRYDEAETAFRNTIDGLAALWGEDSLHVAHALNELSNMLDDKGDLRGSEDALRRALSIRMKTVGPDHHDTLVNQHNLLVVIELQGRFAEALPERIELIERQKRTQNAHPRDLAASDSGLGRDYAHAARFEEAESALRESIAIHDKAVGAGSPVANPARTALASVLMFQGRYAEAEAMQRQAVQVLEAHDPPTSLALAKLRADLSNILRVEHRDAEALSEAQRADEVFAKVAKAGNPWYADALGILSRAELEAGHVTQAETAALKGVALARSTWHAEDFRLANVLFALARVRMAQEKFVEAESLLREALRVRSPVDAASHPGVLETKVELIRALHALGRSDPAKEGEARRFAGEIMPLLQASSSQYVVDLRQRLAAN